MKAARILLIMAILFVSMNTVTYASNFSSLMTKQLTPTYRGNGSVFYDNNSMIVVVFKKISDNEMILGVGKDDKLIYHKTMPYYKFNSVHQIYDKDSGKLFYIIRGANNMDGQGGYLYLMGLDKKNKTWQMYVNPDDYYNPIGESASAHMYVYNGELILQFAEMRLHAKAQKYILLWNDKTHSFDYKDCGLVDN